MDEAKSGSAECEYEKTVQEKPDHCHNAGGDDRSGGILKLYGEPVRWGSGRIHGGKYFV